MQINEKLVYKGFVIKCPLCGRDHGLVLKSSKLNSPSIIKLSSLGDDKIWVKCPTCNLEFEGTAIAIWNRTKAFEVLNRAAKNFTDTMNRLSSIKKTVYTVFLLSEVDHSITRCFRTPTDEENLGEILTRLSKTCRPGESYLAIEEVD